MPHTSNQGEDLRVLASGTRIGDATLCPRKQREPDRGHFQAIRYLDVFAHLVEANAHEECAATLSTMGVRAKSGLPAAPATRDWMLDDMVVNVRDAIAHSPEIQLDVVAIVRRGSLPRTTSGKVQRHLACGPRSAGARRQGRRGGATPLTVSSISHSERPPTPPLCVGDRLVACAT